MYLLGYEHGKGYYLARDGGLTGDYFTDVDGFIKTIKIDGKTFEELFAEEEQGINDQRMASRL